MNLNRENIARLFATIWYYLLPSVFVVALLFSLGFANQSIKDIRFNKLNIYIESEKENAFLDKNDIEKLLSSHIQKPFKNLFLSEIDLFSLEKVLKINSLVDNAEIYNDLKGNIFVELKFRKPIVRVMTVFHDNYMIDEKGNKMDISSKFTPKILVANGFAIKNSANPDFEQQLYLLSKFIYNDNFLKSLIGQIYVDVNRNVILIPKVENLKITFGKIDDIELKFKKLKIYYEKILPSEGWGKYNNIDLRFKNQIVLNKKYE